MPDNMRRVLLDENLPENLRHLITSRDVRTVRYMGWSGLDNGSLIAAVETNGFDAMLTADHDMPYQQNLSGRHLAIIVLNSRTLPVLQDNLAIIIQAIDVAPPATFTTLTLRVPPTPREDTS
jgi:alkanesulfonate monooxygenase SsuD/methylene tetrahydromethanopterin reductase-like flavin-dependent oxidoreductase (luciferase family)